MTHLWLRAEQRDHEARFGLTPDGARALIAAGIKVTVEQSPHRAIAIAGYQAAGCEIAAFATWPDAPDSALIFGLKELPVATTPLPHRHILFGHAYKGQAAGQLLLRRLKAGGGALYDLEALVDEAGRRVAAFGYWAGFAGAAVSLKAWAAQQNGAICGPLTRSLNRAELLADLARDLGKGTSRPRALIIGAKGRVGTGASDLCAAMAVEATLWDIEDTAAGGPFPAVLAHEILLNCILARPGAPVFVPKDAGAAPRALRLIGDIACDPASDFSPIKVYNRSTDWAAPARRVAQDPMLDVVAIDNLPSLLPRESSEDYAAQLLPSLLQLKSLHSGVWGRALLQYQHHSAQA